VAASRILVGSTRSAPEDPSDPVIAADASADAGSIRQRLTILVGYGYRASLVGLLLIAMAQGAWGSSLGLLGASQLAALMALAALFGALHLGHVHRRLASDAAVAMDVVRHRMVIALMAATAACAGPLWAPWPDGHGAFIVVCLLVLLGSGAAAASADRVALALWVGVVAGVPGAWTLAQGSIHDRDVAALLLAGGAVVASLAVFIRQLLVRGWRVRRENAMLIHKLRQQVVLVEAADYEKGRFLGSASHDLRQPMHALGLFAAALEKELRGTPHYPSVVSMAHAVDALEQSFSAMLDISRLDAGVVQTNPQIFPIRDVFRRLHMHCAGQAEEKGLSLRFKPGGKLVTSDPQLLERILSNLVHNAIRYTREGGVIVVARTRRAGISLEVWDTGEGITEEELPKIFNEFYQVDNPGRDRTRGLGMGLSIVSRLVVLLGHTLEVKSTVGKGTVFRIQMPATELAELQTVVLGADTVPSAPVEDRTVLVIDDEEPVRVGMKSLLEGWGYTVLLAGTVRQARQEVRRHAGIIDVVVSDLRLGGDEDGIQAVAEVRQEYGAPLPALLITGDTSPDEVRRAHASGHPVLFKPVRSRDLFAALRGAP
jgi:two-component system, sensor histidine kinase